MSTVAVDAEKFCGITFFRGFAQVFAIYFAEEARVRHAEEVRAEREECGVVIVREFGHLSVFAIN